MVLGHDRAFDFYAAHEHGGTVLTSVNDVTVGVPDEVDAVAQLPASFRSAVAFIGPRQPRDTAMRLTLNQQTPAFGTEYTPATVASQYKLPKRKNGTKSQLTQAITSFLGEVGGGK